jgi:hypothetical protein
VSDRQGNANQFERPKKLFESKEDWMANLNCASGYASRNSFLILLSSLILSFMVKGE